MISRVNEAEKLLKLRNPPILVIFFKYVFLHTYILFKSETFCLGHINIYIV
jgi:hypothetical protein